MTCVNYIPVKLEKRTQVFSYLFIIRDHNSFLWLVVFMVLEWLPKARGKWSLLRSSGQRVLEKSMDGFQEPKQSSPPMSLCILSLLSSFSSFLTLFCLSFFPPFLSPSHSPFFLSFLLPFSLFLSLYVSLIFLSLTITYWVSAIGLSLV